MFKKSIIIFNFFLFICIVEVLIYMYSTGKLADISRANTSKENDAISAISPSPTPTFSPSPTPTIRPIPVSIVIPSLNISTKIESVGVTKSGNMDVPKNATDVAWFQYGPIPGDLGNAVITGHYDTPSGRAAVFYRLKDLSIGDGIEVYFDDSTSRKFTVIEKAEVPFTNSLDKYTEHIFVSRPGINLNLITCDGIWNPVKRTYSTRLVVYTTLKQ